MQLVTKSGLYRVKLRRCLGYCVDGYYPRPLNWETFEKAQKCMGLMKFKQTELQQAYKDMVRMVNYANRMDKKQFRQYYNYLLLAECPLLSALRVLGI